MISANKYEYQYYLIIVNISINDKEQIVITDIKLEI